jgi:hypothetical protein
MTHSIRIFKEIAKVWRSEPMMPRSANDKEYFAQDWFSDRVEAAGLPFVQQGRNSYPDFLVDPEDQVEGFEIKSLAFSKGKPARKDLDFNSSIPSGQKDGHPVFLVFFLYEGRGKDPRNVHTVSITHGDLINADHLVADEHVNVAIHEFGSYGNGFIRNRKMYVFPHPISLDESGLGKCRLIVPSTWKVNDPGLELVGRIERTVAEKKLTSYWINLYGRTEPKILREPSDNAGEVLLFDVLEAK